MIEVVQVFDRAPIAKLESDDAAALERNIETAHRLFRKQTGMADTASGPWTMKEMSQQKMIVFRK
jgi:hypothetical protein